jgi:hypothetical protein
MEVAMPKAPTVETMDLGEKLDRVVKSYELEDQGKIEESIRLRHSVPLQPYLAKWFKENLGAEELKKSGWNLSEAEAAYGRDWLNK